MKKPILLSAQQFQSVVLSRDDHVCVFCDREATAAHHIIDMALFSDGGYYQDNGVSLCGEHLLQYQMTMILPAEMRMAAGIHSVVLPEHLYVDQPYDRWANPLLPNGSRLKGDLYFEDGVQELLLLGGFLEDFLDEVKYPRTHHMPWSRSISNDDRVHKSMEKFKGKWVIVTRKMDGENCSMYYDYIHARSLDSQHHPSRDWVKAFWGNYVRYQIPEGWRICGEDLYALHSIKYNDLPSYFMGFSMWDERNNCLSWDDTLEWFELLGIKPVEVVWEGIYDEEIIRKLCDELDVSVCEGLVLRVADSFSYAEFKNSVAKFVREGHVQTDEHWRDGPLIPNGLKK